MEEFAPDLLYIVIAGFVFAFILAFGIGANDVANSFGTSVGSKVLTLVQACILATIFEIAGAVLIGYKVSDTMRKGIVDAALYNGGGERQLAAGCLAALVAGAAWLLLATAARLPISGTHSIVGATVGFTLAAKGPVGIHWNTLGAIVASWFISPVLSGMVSAALYWAVRGLILRAARPLHAALRSLPLLYGATVFVNVISVVHDGPKMLKFDVIPLWAAALGSGALGAAVAGAVQLLLVPHYRRRFQPAIAAEPVRFAIGPSNDTTPLQTPVHLSNGVQRPTSLISEDGKLLEAITETAEMVTLSDADKISLKIRLNAKNRALLATMEDCSILSRSLSPPKQHLAELDQLITLRFIDESNSCCKSIESCQLAGIAESYGSGQLRGLLGSSCETVALASGGGAGAGLEYERVPTATLPLGTPCAELEVPLQPHTLPMMTPNSSAAPLLREVAAPSQPGAPDAPEQQLFSFLQVLTATFGAFAHGGNDVSNAIGPLVALWLLWSEGSAVPRAETPLGILVFGGVGIAAGLWLWGRRVIETVGQDLTSITPDTGFTIEVGAALTVLVASKAGLPVSTTHCKVGSVVSIGYVSRRGVDWTLFRNIIFAWVVTVPAVGGMAAGCMLIFDWLIV